jgi:galactokinase
VGLPGIANEKALPACHHPSGSHGAVCAVAEGYHARVGSIVRAPGRVNLIGEHTDYNDGYVLPVAIDLEVRISLAASGGHSVRLRRSDTDEQAVIDLARLPPPGDSWHDYVSGTAWAMSAAGLPVTGFDGVVTSTVPIGAGLSSSAALELAAAWALSGNAGPAVTPMELARLAQHAENEHVGVRCGLMDQFASACGVADHALLLDCRSREWRAVPLPDDVALVVTHTGVPRALGASAYNERRADCEEVVAIISRELAPVESLRDVDADLLAAARPHLTERAHARAEHVIGENQRVLAFVDALEAGDIDALGPLLAESHASLRDRYEVSCTELDALVDIATSVDGVVGSRMTGAGFGGCTVTLVRPDAITLLRAHIEREYPMRTGRHARMWTVNSVDGAGWADSH